MIKCLLNLKDSNYVIYLDSIENKNYLDLSEFKKCFKNKYLGLIVENKIDLEKDLIEIFDEDFLEYVVLDSYSQIKNLTKLKLNKIEKNVKNVQNYDGKYKSISCQTVETEKRIIKLIDCPSSEKYKNLKIDYEKLIEDNKKLSTKIELYKRSNSADTTKILDDIISRTDEIEKLEIELKEAKDAQKTIMEAFKKKSKEFRRVVYLLTGFKFDALEQKKYKVSHIYYNPDEYLYFTFEKEEIINLLANDFSEKFYDLFKIYLVKHDSYPAFLASVTIRLFEEKLTKKPIEFQ